MVKNENNKTKQRKISTRVPSPPYESIDLIPVGWFRRTVKTTTKTFAVEPNLMITIYIIAPRRVVIEIWFLGITEYLIFLFGFSDLFFSFFVLNRYLFQQKKYILFSIHNSKQWIWQMVLICSLKKSIE